MNSPCRSIDRTCTPWLRMPEVDWSYLAAVVLFAGTLLDVRAATPARARHGMVVSQDALASGVGVEILRQGGNAIDAAVATAFALAVTHPAAGNIGGGGFLLYRAPDGTAVAYDFREKAPAAAEERMFMPEGRYDPERHHWSALAVGVPGTVAGLHLAWQDHGTLPWRRLIKPAINLAQRGFTVSPGLADSLRAALPRMRPYPASMAQFSRSGQPYAAGDRLVQRDLARTLERIARQGPAGFYDGPTADLLVREMNRLGGCLTRADLRAYEARRRVPVRGGYRGLTVLSMPPPSSGGVALLQMLRVLEGFDLASAGPGSARSMHWTAEAMRRAFADRARYLGDPDFNPDLPVDRLISAEHAAALRHTIDPTRASSSAPQRFEWPPESEQTTHLSVADAARGLVALTYTLEDSYGSGIVVPGAGFLLNNEMGDFNPVPGLTTTNGLIGTPPNLVAPHKRMLSSMCPTIVENAEGPLLALGSPGGRTIINTVLLTLLNLVDFGLNLQDAVDAPRFHHQWLPDVLQYERNRVSPDTLERLRSLGHSVAPSGVQGVVGAIRIDHAGGWIEGAADRRAPDSAALGW